MEGVVAVGLGREGTLTRKKESRDGSELMRICTVTRVQVEHLCNASVGARACIQSVLKDWAKLVLYSYKN